MSTNLQPGDRCYILSEHGLKLRGIIADYLQMPVRCESGTAKLYPFQRNGRTQTLWVARGDIRKLPAPLNPSAPKAKKLSPKMKIMHELDDAVRAGTMTLVEAQKLLNRYAKNKWSKEFWHSMDSAPKDYGWVDLECEDSKVYRARHAVLGWQIEGGSGMAGDLPSPAVKWRWPE